MSRRTIFLLILYSTIINIIITPFNPNIAKYFGYLSIILFSIFPIIQNRRIYIQKSVLLLFVLIILSQINSIKYYGLPLLLDVLPYIVAFFAFYSLIQMDYELKISFDAIYYPSLLLAFFFVFQSFICTTYSYMVVNVFGNKVFNMGLGNPNAVSIYVLFVIMVFMIKIITNRSVLRNCFLIAMIGLMTWVLVKLESRTVIACVVVALFFSIIKDPNKNKIVRWIACVLPLAIIPIIVKLAGSDIAQATILGKAADTGRGEIYASVLNHFISNPLDLMIGSFFQYPLVNLHNGPLTLVASIGLIGFIVIVFIWKKVIRNIGKTIDLKERALAFDFIFLFIAHSATESMSILGAVPYSVFIFIIISIARGNIVVMNHSNGNITSRC